MRKAFPARFFKKSFWFIFCLLLLVIGVQGFKLDLSTGFSRPEETEGSFNGGTNDALSVWVKQDLRKIINSGVLYNSPGGKVDIRFSGRKYTMETTLDQEFQSYMVKRIKRSRSPMIGFVAMDPTTGRILAMVDSNKINRSSSVCLSSQFPAASIFKIVSAAAAIDSCDIHADTRLAYNGKGHTLYKSQLKDRTNRYTNYVSLKNSFAKSINPVFGKLGIFRLKKDLLEEYAIRFGFNQWIDFELPVGLSRISVGDEPYQFAEVASGFNRKTLISPLHAAMIASVVVNDGRLVEPTIIESIIDNEKKPVYVGSTNIIRQVISQEASCEMKELMEATISRGTCCGTFNGHSRDPVLSKLSIGGKTGSISSSSHEFRYDWFVGFCEEKQGTRKIALAILVVHDELLRKQARQFAHRAIKRYFSRG